MSGVPLGVERPRAAAAAAGAGKPMLFFRAGPHHFVVDALSIEGAEPKGRIRRNAPTAGFCLGVIARAGAEIPVICPIGAFGIGPLGDPTEAEVVILRLDGGKLIGLAMSAVRDIRRVAQQEALPLPGLQAGPSRFFKALISEPDGAQSLALDMGALSREPMIAALSEALPAGKAEAGAPLEPEPDRDRASPNGVGTQGRSDVIPDRRQHLTFRAGVPLACPLTDVREITHRPAAPAAIPGGGPGFVGVWRHRDRVTPLFSLARALGMEPAGPEPHVMIVDGGAGPVGFAIESLTSIEPAVWRTAPPAGGAAGDASALRLVRIGEGAAGRALAWIDAPALARALRGEDPAQPV
jgi:chemotaxis signal transduction protein